MVEATLNKAGQYHPWGGYWAAEKLHSVRNMTDYEKNLDLRILKLLFLFAAVLTTVWSLGVALPATENVAREPVRVESEGVEVPGLKCRLHSQRHWQCDGTRVSASEALGVGGADVDKALNRRHRFVTRQRVLIPRSVEEVAPDTFVIKDGNKATVAKRLSEREKYVFFHFSGKAAQDLANRFKEAV